MCTCLHGFVYVIRCQFVCVCVCVFGAWLRRTLAAFTDFNDWTLGTTGVCVPWDLLLLTEGVKGTGLTFAFCPDSRWTANQEVIFGCHC